MAEDFTIDSLIEDLKGISNTETVGGFVFTELTVEQQRKTYLGGASFVELQAKVRNVHNKYIMDSVAFEDDPVRVASYVNLEQRPYMLMILRRLSMGDIYVDREGKEYSIYRPTDDDLVQKIKPKTIKRGQVSINLRVPTLDIDTQYNTQITGALSVYRKKGADSITDGDFAVVQELYQMYEVMKYIESIEFGSKKYEFQNLSIADKTKVLNTLPELIMSQIQDYIMLVSKVEEKAYSVISLESGEPTELDAVTIFSNRKAASEMI